MNIENFYIKYSDGMMRYAAYLLKNRHDAEDAVSDCVLRLMRSARFSDIDDEAYAKSYAFAALRSVCITELRKRGRQEELSEEAASSRGEMSDAEARLDIGRCVKRLGGDKEKVLRMRLFGEYSVRDISAALGMNESNVKIIIHRGKKELVRILGDKYAC